MEVAVVLIIVGIFIAGIFVSSTFFTKFRITAAQTLTRSAPIYSIKDNALWLETSLDNSFNAVESRDTSSLTTWYEQRNTTNKVFLQAADGGPTYSNTINRIHAVRFAGAGYFTFDGSFLNNTDYTITILEKREASGGGNYFLGDSASATTNQSILLGYNADGQIIHSQGSSSSYQTLGSYTSSDTPRILTFTHSSTAGKKLYINGILAGQDEANTSALSNISTLSFGKGYSGQVGELAIFTRALEADEIKSVEDYVAQKFNVKLVRNSAADCLGGVVTTSGCDVGGGGGGVTCAVSVTGVTSTTPVGVGSGSLTCDGTNFNGGTISYTCSGGSLSTGSSCDCADGYVLSGSSCVASAANCSVAITGVSTPTTVNIGDSGTFTCDATYTGAVNYSCAAGGVLNTVGVCVPQPSVQYFVLTSGSSHAIPANTSQVKVWAIGAGGGGGGSNGTVNDSVGSGGGAGGVAYKTWSVTSGGAIAYSIGAAGTGGAGVDGTNGGDTTATYSGVTITGGGGQGGRLENAATVSGGTFSGGDGGSNGGSAPGRVSTTGRSGVGATSGGAIGGVSGLTNGNVGGAGVNSANVSELFTALASADYAVTAGGAAGGSAGGTNIRHGTTATGFGCSGGGAGWYGGNGGNGLYGGGGGGSSIYTTGSNTGGNGGGGAVVIRYDISATSGGSSNVCSFSISGTSVTAVAYGTSGSISCNESGYTGSVNYTCSNIGAFTSSGSCVSSISYVVLTSGTSYTIPPVLTTQAKIWAIGAGGGGGGTTGNRSAGGGAAGGVAYKTWSGISPGSTISYSLGASGAGGVGGNNGSSGGSTTVTYQGVTITGGGGGGGRYNNTTSSVGGDFSGGDGGSNGGGTVGKSGDIGGSAGAAIGGVNGSAGNIPVDGYGGNGALSADVSGLFAVLSAVGGYPTTSGGVGASDQNAPANGMHGTAATGFGCGGGGGGWWGGSGGAGRYGGGGGGASGEGSNQTGGAGGAGVVVIKFF